MKRLIIITLMSLSLTSCIGAGEISEIRNNGKDNLPSLIGIDLVGKNREVPHSFKGEYQIVILAFEREQSDQVNSWMPAIEKVISENKNINFYEIPLIYEVSAPQRFWINNGMRSGITDPIKRTQVITVYTDRNKFTAMMSMDTKSIYTMLVKKGGKILWRVAGKADEEKIGQLISKIKEIIK